MIEAVAAMPELGKKNALLNVIDSGVASLFQPIIKTDSGGVMGYEVLSRGVAPLESACDLFGAAKDFGYSKDLEYTCIRSALKRISEEDRDQNEKFFLNVSAESLFDPRMRKLLSPAMLRKQGLSPNRLVFEISEKTPVPPDTEFAETIAEMKSFGIGLAIDDLGSGYSSLRSIIAVSPDYLKLDISVVRGIDQSPERLRVARGLICFAGLIGAQIIAEGVETENEFYALVEQGVELVQGFLFCRPEHRPAGAKGLYTHIASRRKNVFRPPGITRGFADRNGDEHVGSIMQDCCTVEENTMNCEELDVVFSNNPDIDHVPLLNKGTPGGLITRSHFYSKTAGAFGYALHKNKPIESLSKQSFLVVGADEPIQSLYKKVMDRDSEDVYDPVIVTCRERLFVGTVTIRQLILRAGELETEQALNNNPLSGLPGNRRVERWILEAQKSAEDFTVVYADLNNFKEYNDRYGFIKGDEMITFTASILKQTLCLEDTEIRLGHIGGDDFVFINSGSFPEEVLCAVCRCFDSGRNRFFQEDDLLRGFYDAKDRKGKHSRTPLVSISLAALESSSFDKWKHPAELAEIAAGLKNKVKQKAEKSGGSAYLFERRDYRT